MSDNANNIHNNETPGLHSENQVIDILSCSPLYLGGDSGASQRIDLRIDDAASECAIGQAAVDESVTREETGPAYNAIIEPMQDTTLEQNTIDINTETTLDPIPATTTNAEPTKTNKHKTEECPICYIEVEGCVTTWCGHTFCVECLASWFNERSRCPSCNTWLNPGDITTTGIRDADLPELPNLTDPYANDIYEERWANSGLFGAAAWEAFVDGNSVLNPGGLRRRMRL